MAPGRPAGRWRAAQVLAAVLALSCGAVAQGDGETLPAEHHEVVVQLATVDVAYEPDLVNLVEANNGTDPTTGVDSCGGPFIAVDQPGGSFRFAEQSLQTGCADAYLNVTIPPGARDLVVTFAADRSVTGFGDSLASTLAGSLLQHFTILAPGFERRLDYFDDTSGSQNATVFMPRFSIAEVVGKTDRISLVWHFEDRGSGSGQALTVGTGQAFAAQVSNISVAFPSLPLQPAVEIGEEVVAEDGLTATRVAYVDLGLPAFAIEPADALDPSVAGRPTATAEVQVAITEGPALANVTGPRGALDPQRFLVVEGNQRVLVVLPGNTTAEQGSGTYRFGYSSTRALPPPPPPAVPSRIYAFYYVLALLPMVAAVLALHQAVQYAKQAEGPYRRTAWPVLLAVGLGVTYYLLLLAYSYFGLGPREMATLPLSSAALLVYIQLVVLLILLAAAALAVSRTLLRTMRRDLAERERKEDQLRRSNEELERFAYVASHDLQEPLRKVAGFTALLQKKYGGRLDKDADEIIGYAVDGATRMQLLIKDILAYSRVGSKELNRVAVDAGSVLELVTADLGQSIQATKARVTWSGLPTVRADASQLRQVLQNLVENALKYRHPKRRPTVRVAASEDGGDWHFTVKDNGIGIPADKLEEVFGIFRRLHGADQPGTGIGLAVAKKAIERHGGRIWVESRTGRGSTFHFTLPRGAFDGPGRWEAAPGRAGRRSVA